MNTSKNPQTKNNKHKEKDNLSGLPIDKYRFDDQAKTILIIFSPFKKKL